MTRAAPARFTALLWLAVFGSFGCWPAHPANDQLIGTWEVDHDQRREQLVLAGDGTYRQIFTGRDGGVIEHAGRWDRGADARLSLSGLKVILRHALVFDSPADKQGQTPQSEDRELEAVTEWGQTKLIFNPDLPGFLKK